MRNLMKELDRARTIIRKLEATYTFEDIFGGSSDIEISVEQAKLAAKSEVPVLLRGETGTGKELFAHAIHSGSKRRFHKFIRVNCATMNATAFESELFGQNGELEKGQGLFEESDQGTLFLDEVADLPLAVQQRLLTYLADGANDSNANQLSVRIITATSKTWKRPCMKDFSMKNCIMYLIGFPFKLHRLDPE